MASVANLSWPLIYHTKFIRLKYLNVLRFHSQTICFAHQLNAYEYKQCTISFNNCIEWLGHRWLLGVTVCDWYQISWILAVTYVKQSLRIPFSILVGLPCRELRILHGGIDVIIFDSTTLQSRHCRKEHLLSARPSAMFVGKLNQCHAEIYRLWVTGKNSWCK